LSSRGLVLVTGGSGAVGSQLLRALGERGWRRRCLVHRRPVSDAEELLSGDLTDPSSLLPAVDGVTAIAHLAAVTHSRSPGRYNEVNFHGTKNLVDAAGRSGVERFLFVSTRAISPDGGAYSSSKHQAEGVVRACSLRWTIVRLPEVYGAESVEGVDRMIELARRGGRIPVVGRGDDLICPAHVDDVIPACARALEAAAAVGRTYTLAGPCVTVRTFADAVGDVLRRPPRILRVPVAAASALATAARILPLPVYPDQLARLRSPKPAASPEAESDLLFRPRSLQAGLAEIVARSG
jgi:nucleoside-diphosphate-sugar epimerase